MGKIKVYSNFSDLLYYECKWYVRLWRWIFPSKPFTLKNMKKVIKIMRKNG